MLLFRLYEKVTKKYPRGLLTSGLRGPVQNSERWITYQNTSYVPIRKSLWEIAALCHTARKYFEPVRDGGFTVQGFAIFL